MYFLLTGQHAFTSDAATSPERNEEILRKIGAYDFVHLPDLVRQEQIPGIDERAAQIVDWAMAWEPDDRPSAKELRKEIERYQK